MAREVATEATERNKNKVNALGVEADADDTASEDDDNESSEY